MGMISGECLESELVGLLQKQTGRETLVVSRPAFHLDMH